MKTYETIKIAVVDDDAILAESLAGQLSRFPDIKVLRWHHDPADCLDHFNNTDLEQPQIVITDFRMPRMNGLELCRKLQQSHPDVRPIMLTNLESAVIVENAVCYGVRAYLLKDVSASVLRQAIQEVHRYGIHLNRHLTREMVHELVRYNYTLPPERRFPVISPREQEVLRYISRGHSNKEIARHLEISVKTVEAHTARLKQKLGVHKTTALVSQAIRHGLI